jgi:hypothetical protein
MLRLIVELLLPIEILIRINVFLDLWLWCGRGRVRGVGHNGSKARGDFWVAGELFEEGTESGVAEKLFSQGAEAGILLKEGAVLQCKVLGFVGFHVDFVFELADVL